MTVSVRPFLLFQEGKAEEAITFYTSLIPGSRTDTIERYDASGPGPEGTVFRASFTVGDQTVLCTDSIVRHDFTFTPSFSFWVECESEAQLEHLLAALSDGGMVHMPPDDYGFSQRFAWVADRFGVSWQLNVSRP
jgi:predicted 3-demethylubiquinone-9 3-methyltransferase (glyoxalase superfamily)